MLVDEAIQKTYLFASGKATMPAVGSTKYVKILSLLNTFKDVWAREPGTQWESIRSLQSLIPLVTATDTFALPTAVLNGTAKLSTQEGDYVRVIWTSGTQESDFTLVKDSRLYRDGPSVNNPGSIGINTSGNCARRGSSLVFDVPFTATSPEIGGTIKIPVYTTPADMVDSTTDPDGIVPVDDPYWVIYMAAAEFVRNDVTKQNQYGNLVNLAINCMEGMKEDNLTQQESVYMPGQLGSAMGETW
jgi:hypothetical protein